MEQADKNIATRVGEPLPCGVDKKKLKNGWLDFLVAQRYTHAVTFKPNPSSRGLSLGALHTLFCKVHMLVDRKLLGRQFNRPSRSARRSEAVGIVEGLPDSGHLHGAFKVRPEDWAKFEKLFSDGTCKGERTGIWRKLAPHGTCAIVPIYDAERWHDYTFKDVWLTDDSDRIVFAPLPVVSPAPRK